MTIDVPNDINYTYFILVYVQVLLPLQMIKDFCKMNKQHKNKYLIAAAICLILVFGLTYYYFFTSFTTAKSTYYIYVDNDDTADSVVAKLTPIAVQHSLHGFTTLLRHSKYAEHIRTGRYAIKPGQGAFVVFRHLKNGVQAPVSLTIPSVRTMDRLASELSKKLMLDSTTILRALNNKKKCLKYGYNTYTIACMFIPNTYDIYWNINIDKLLDRMHKESNNFWNSSRKAKAKNLNLTENQVITLASIVDEETANNQEKPMIAGMYYNRLMVRTKEYPEGMPLQADPTIKFAWKKFDLRRIYQNLLFIDSPYNTYKYPGLPPGPIRIPTIAGIDAVLNMVHHDYLYMCAKEDFSGTHNFARTYHEHLANASKYAAALDKHGIQ